MAEEVTNTVKTVGDGTVKITLEKYQELLSEAAQKAPVVYNTIHKTPRMVAEENKLWGSVMMYGGLALAGIGYSVRRIGKRQFKAL